MVIRPLGLLLGFFVVAALPLGAQSDSRRFEVASVKRATPGETGGRVRFLPGGRFLGENVSLEFVIQQVYQLRDFQLGLVLDARRAPLPVIVIDSVEQLTPN